MRRLSPAQGAEPVAVGCAEVLARPRGPALALTRGVIAAGVSRPPREAAATPGARGLGRAGVLSRAAGPVTVGAGPALSCGAAVLGRPALGRPARGAPATGSVRLTGCGRAEVLSRAAGRARDIESGGRAWVRSRAKPVSNGAAVLVPPPRRTPATGSVRLTVRRRARDVKGGSPAKVLGRAAIGARPAAGEAAAEPSASGARREERRPRGASDSPATDEPGTSKAAVAPES